MTYRNDHDAALARIDSLEQELDELKSKPTPPEVVSPKRHALRIATIASVAALVAGGVWLRHRESAPHAPSESAPTLHVYAPTDVVRPCLTAVLAAPGSGFDARSTDPHAGGRSVAPIEKVGASCRRELAEVTHAIGLDDHLRATYQRWLATEDTLAGDISRILVYYANDPYALDNYATATQLWREYETDRAARDAALPAVVRELQQDQPNT